MEYRYEDSDYVLYDKGKIVKNVGDEIAIAFSYDPDTCEGVLHKHGEPEIVMAWVMSTRKTYMEQFRVSKNALYKKQAREILTLGGTIDVDELNKCINNSGYIGIYYKKIKEESLN